MGVKDVAVRLCSGISIDPTSAEGRDTPDFFETDGLPACCTGSTSCSDSRIEEQQPGTSTRDAVSSRAWQGIPSMALAICLWPTAPNLPILSPGHRNDRLIATYYIGTMLWLRKEPFFTIPMRR